jgi:hypothetical protein
MPKRHHEDAGESGGAAAPTGHDNGRDRPDLETQIASLAAQIRQIGERLADGQAAAREKRIAPRGAASVTVDPVLYNEASGPPDATAALNERVLDAAEAVAAEIRAGAEREAERIRTAAAHAPSGAIDELATIVARHRQAIAALTSETDRIEHGVAILRAQARVLDAELRVIEESISGLEPPPR